MKIKEFSNELDFVVINDGSKDSTLKILQENNLNHINLVNNLGIGGAVQCPSRRRAFSAFVHKHYRVPP